MKALRSMYRAAACAAALPVALLLLGSRRGRTRFRERFGFWNLCVSECIWFHGASLGEINGLLPVMRALKAKHPDLPLLVSATSPTGLERAQGLAEHCRILPLDNPPWIRRALKDISIKAFVFAETELWPCLIEELSARRVPMYLVNARISDRSFPRYKIMRSFWRETLRRIDWILASAQVHKDRFIELGARPERVEVAGNAKYDVPPLVRSQEEALALRKAFFGSHAPVLVLGSLRPGEEEVWFPALKAASQNGRRVNVVVAPRHEEKFLFFAERLLRYGLAFEKWSGKRAQTKERAEPSSIVLLDTMGDLNRVYSFAGAAFIGATLVPIGGHNPLEPAAYGVCPVLGPHTANVADVVQLLQANQACISVAGSADAMALIDRLCSGDPELKLQGRRAQQVWQGMHGAVDRILQRLCGDMEGAV